MQHRDICYGIDSEVIQEALNKAGRGQIQYGVTVARGIPPKAVEPDRIECREDFESRTQSFKRLQRLLQGHAVEALSGWSESVPTVR